MIHPSYSELMTKINANGTAEDPVVKSRYSIVMGTAKRARQLVAAEHYMYNGEKRKALSIAVEELYRGEIHILREGENEEAYEMPGDMVFGAVADIGEEDDENAGSFDDSEDEYDDEDELDLLMDAEQYSEYVDLL